MYYMHQMRVGIVGFEMTPVMFTGVLCDSVTSLVSGGSTC